MSFLLFRACRVHVRGKGTGRGVVVAGFLCSCFFPFRQPVPRRRRASMIDVSLFAMVMTMMTTFWDIFYESRVISCQLEAYDTSPGQGLVAA